MDPKTGEGRIFYLKVSERRRCEDANMKSWEGRRERYREHIT
tara:strand:- start:562 stop:687 length:126 start_codon:yes stop_codon:yes gene_type:complete